jgi:transposase
LLHERFAIEVQLAARGVSAAAELLGLSWDQMHLSMERAVARGLRRHEWEGLCHLGLDEKSFGRGQSSISLLTDLEGSRVLEVAPDNDRAAAVQLLASLPEPVREAVEAVCVEMSGHFGATVRAGLPQAAVVHDRFHLSTNLNEAVAAVHREENRRLQKLGAERLKGTQRPFGFDPDKLNQEQAVKFAELKASDLKSARAWAIKEVFRRFWYDSYEGSARKLFQN